MYEMRQLITYDTMETKLSKKIKYLHNKIVNVEHLSDPPTLFVY